MVGRRSDLCRSDFEALIASVLRPTLPVPVIALDSTTMDPGITGVGASTLPRLSEALIPQDLQRPRRCRPRHLPFLRDLTLGRQLAARRKVSPYDLLTEVARDLKVLRRCLFDLGHLTLSGREDSPW